MHRVQIDHSDWRRIKTGLALIRGHASWLEHRHGVSPSSLSIGDVSERVKEITAWSFSIERILSDGEYTKGVWGTRGPDDSGLGASGVQEQI